MWATHFKAQDFAQVHKGGKCPRSGGKKHDRSGDGAECEGIERNRKRSLRSTCCCTEKSGWWGHGLKGEVMDGVRRIRCRN